MSATTSEPTEIQIGDVVEILESGTLSGHRVTVTGVESVDDKSYLLFFNPCEGDDCDCDPYSFVALSAVRKVVIG